MVVADIEGIIHRGRPNLDPSLRWIAEHTNADGFAGTLKEAVRGADVFIGVSAPNLLDGDDIAAMADAAIVFALANPDPEVDPAAASEHAAVVATGRSDYPNQINNVLAFPGVFRGLLDATATAIDSSLLAAAADAIARVGQRRRAQRQLRHPERLPRRGAQGGGRSGQGSGAGGHDDGHVATRVSCWSRPLASSTRTSAGPSC